MGVEYLGACYEAMSFGQIPKNLKQSSRSCKPLPRHIQMESVANGRIDD
jgi:hypothetical protein